VTIRCELHPRYDALLQILHECVAEIFDVAVSGVSRHLKRIFDEGELAEAAVVTSGVIAATDGKLYETKLYELEARAYVN
jgi:hypothetical protein